HPTIVLVRLLLQARCAPCGRSFGPACSMPLRSVACGATMTCTASATSDERCPRRPACPSPPSSRIPWPPRRHKPCLEPISVGGAKAGEIGKSPAYWDRLLWYCYRLSPDSCRGLRRDSAALAGSVAVVRSPTGD